MRPLQIFLAVTLIGCTVFFLGCQPGSEITEYQAPAQILRTFRSEHPGAQAVSYRQMTKDGVKVFLVQYIEGEEEKEVWYNVQGKPFVSRAERRSAEQERQKQQEESESKAKEEADEKASQTPEKAPAPAAKKPAEKTSLPSSGHGAVP